MLNFLPNSYGPVFIDNAEMARRARRQADTAQHRADRLSLEADRLEALSQMERTDNGKT